MWQLECQVTGHIVFADKEPGQAVKLECMSLKVPSCFKRVPTAEDQLFKHEPMGEAFIHSTAEPTWRMLWGSFCLRNTALPL